MAKLTDETLALCDRIIAQCEIDAGDTLALCERIVREVEWHAANVQRRAQKAANARKAA